MVKKKQREKDELEFHWLGEGINGQQALAAELDPYIYRSDQTIFQKLKASYFERGAGEEKGKLLLCPPDDALGYQMGALAEIFDVFIQTRSWDEFSEEVAEHFRVALLRDGLPYELNGRLSNILYTNYRWDSLMTFRELVRKALTLLSAEGYAHFLLPGQIQSQGAVVSWDDGSSTPLAEIEQGEVFRLPVPNGIELLPFAAVASIEDDYLRRFLKRHRSYFGRAALGPCLERMNEVDFHETLLGKESKTKCAVLCSWCLEGEYLEKIA